MVRFTVLALEATVIFIVEVPDPGAAIDDGVKLTVTPLALEAVRATAELKPPEIDDVMVKFADPPRLIETLVGEAVIAIDGIWVVPLVSAVISAGFGLPQPVTRSYPVTAE